MPEEWRSWKHITKLDPDRNIRAEDIKTIVESQTDAIMISGTQNITKDKVQKLIDLLKGYDIPKILEPAGPNAMIYSGVDWIFVPSVFNTENAVWVNGLHSKWIKADKDKINWDIVVPEAYIILNPKCAAAKVSKAKIIPKDEVVAAALCAERFFNFPIIYIEYSGTYGDPAIVKAVKEALTKAHLLYGGGISTKEQAEEMAKYATIVVGNTIYERGPGSFVDTMRGALTSELATIQAKLQRLKELKEKDKGSEKIIYILPCLQ